MVQVVARVSVSGLGLMLLLHLTRRVVRAEKITAADLFDAPAERVIASGRIFLCAMSVIAVQIDPSQPLRYASSVRLILWIYFAAAIAVAMLCAQQRMHRSLVQLTHLGDIIATSLLLLLTEGPGSPFFAFFTFVLLAAALRWDWPAVAASAGSLIALFLASTAFIGSTPASSMPDDNDLNSFVIRASYLIVAAAMLAYVSAYRARNHARLAELAAWVPAVASSAANDRIANTLAHSARILEAPRVVVIWYEQHVPEVSVALWENNACRITREILISPAEWIAPEVANAPFLFDGARSRRVQGPSGPVVVSGQAINESLVRRFNMKHAATAPLRGTVCKGRVFILDRESWSDDHMTLIDVVAARIAMDLDRDALQLEFERLVANRERNRLVRDLHDGVLQTLTAASLHLKTSATGADTEMQARLAAIGGMLTSEQRRIREFVARSRANPDLKAETSIDDELGRLLSEAGRRWNCAVGLSVTPTDARVSASLGTELSFLCSEAVANAARHGAASRIDVEATLVDDRLVINIRDNGGGFSFGGIDRPDGSLKVSAVPFSINSRVVELNGRCDVFSSPEGAELQIQLPVV